jgi:hypothetical protein
MASHKVGLALGVERSTLALGDDDIGIAIGVPPTDDPVVAIRAVLAQAEQAMTTAGIDATDPSTRIKLEVALLPPLCDVRLVELPPMRPEEIDAVLRREAPHHFLGGNRPMVVGGERLGGKDGGGSVLAAAAPRTLMDALQRAVEARGWDLERVVPAHASWLVALDDVVPASGHGVRAVVAVDGGTAHVVRLVGEAPQSLRRVPAADVTGVLEAAGEDDPGRVLVLAEAGAASALTSGFQAAGWGIAPSPSGKSTSPAAAAARHAAVALPELVPAPLAFARREKSRRLTVQMLAASVVMLAAAAVVHLWGTARQVRAVRQERAEISAAVAPALDARDSLDMLQGRIESLRSLGGEASQWTFSLVELAMLLPPETHLVSLMAKGDTAVVEAAGGRAGDALTALRNAPTLKDVRLEGAIERDIQNGETTGERFTLSALLAHAPATGSATRRPMSDRGDEP